MRGEIGEFDFMEKEAIQKLSITDRLYVLYVLLSMPVVTAYHCARWVVPSEDPQRTGSLVRFLARECGVYLFNALSIKQLRMVLPVRPLREEMEARPLRNTNDLNGYNSLFRVDNASARWVYEQPVRAPEDPVVLYLHGGGFFLKIMYPQIAWCINLARRLNERNRRVSVLAVDYTISPYKKYPAQLDEATRVYKELSKSSTKIVILGDSAGGNLAAALLARIHDLALQPAFGALFVSPWVSIVHGEQGSYVDHTDYLNIEDKYWRMYATSHDLFDPLANPIAGSAEFWRPRMPQRTAAVWGGRELLRDDCEKWAAAAGIANTYQEPNGLHDVMVLGSRFKASRWVLQTLDGWLGMERARL